MARNGQSTMLRVWGLLDLLYFAYYVAGELSLGRIPFLSEIRAPQVMAGTWESAVPPVVVVVSALLLLSLLASGYALLLRRPYGRFLVYGQLPLRLLLVVLVLCTEAWKVFSVRRGSRHSGPSRGGAAAIGA